MRGLLIAVAVLCVTAADGLAAAQAPAASDQARARAYYARLLKDPTRGAELDLFATLLPKGGDLHHHYSGALYAETYLDWMGRQGWCVHADTLRIEPGPRAEPASDPAARCETADQVLKDESLYRRLLMRWSDKDFANHSHEALPPDQQFFDTFGFFATVSGQVPREGLAMLKQRALAENVQYIESMLRSVPMPAPPAAAEALDRLPVDAPPGGVDTALQAAFAALEQDSAAQDAVRAYRAEVAQDAAGLDGDGFAMRFQAYVSRNSSPAQVFAGLYGAFKAAQDNPLIVGVNIVGPENGEVAMRDYALHMRMFRLLEARYPGTHLAMHAGELAQGMVPPEGLRFHIRQAVDVAGAERIGHGIDIAHEDDAWQLLGEMKRRGVAVEINLTSNEFILGVAGNDHPVTLYRRAGVPVVISTDDAGVSRSSLSHEYALFIARYHPTYAQLKAIVYDSLRHSFLSAADQRAQLRELDARFARFEAQVARLPSRQ